MRLRAYFCENDMKSFLFSFLLCVLGSREDSGVGKAKVLSGAYIGDLEWIWSLGVWDSQKINLFRDGHRCRFAGI